MRVLTEMLFYEIRARPSDRHNQISDCQNPENTQSMTMTGRLFPGLPCIADGSSYVRAGRCTRLWHSSTDA